MLAPLAEAVRGVLTAILAGAGIAYSLYILALARGRPELTEREPLWDGVLPIAGLACLLLSAASWFFAPEHADELAALAAAVLLITALRNSWAMTLAILSRRGAFELYHFPPLEKGRVVRVSRTGWGSPWRK